MSEMYIGECELKPTSINATLAVSNFVMRLSTSMTCRFGYLLIVVISVTMVTTGLHAQTRFVAELQNRAEQGNAEAQFMLGSMYTDGTLVDQNDVEAARWLLRAAEQGYQRSFFPLALAYSEGIGVPQDFVNAHMWVNIASALLVGEDRSRAVAQRGRLESRMGVTQIAEAQRLARLRLPFLQSVSGTELPPSLAPQGERSVSSPVEIDPPTEEPSATLAQTIEPNEEDVAAVPSSEEEATEEKIDTVTPVQGQPEVPRPSSLLADAETVEAAEVQRSDEVASSEEPSSSLFDRMFFTVGGMYRTTTTTFSDKVTFEKYYEDAHVEVDYVVGPGAFLDVMGGVRLARFVGIGGAVSNFTSADQLSRNAKVATSIPHPIQWNRHRSATGSTRSYRRELAVHLHGFAATSLGDRVSLMFFGGPSWFRTRHDLVTGITFEELGDTIRFESAQTSEQGASVWGFNVGTDLSIFFTEHFGLGVLVRYSRAMPSLLSADGDRVTMEAGGLDVSGGLRVRLF